MPFPIQRIQMDREREFLADEVQYDLMDKNIKRLPNKPRSPHLNGKVERFQKTDWDEFYSWTDCQSDHFLEEFKKWGYEYNSLRPHSSLGSQTPTEKLQQVKDRIPSQEENEKRYDPKKERLREANYYWDRIMANCFERQKKESL